MIISVHLLSDSVTSTILTWFSHRPAGEKENVRGDEKQFPFMGERRYMHCRGKVNWTCKRGERAAIGREMSGGSLWLCFSP